MIAGGGLAVTFEDYIRTQSELRATVSVRLGQAADGSHASIMTWSDKSDGTHFWRVDGDAVRLIQFVGSD